MRAAILVAVLLVTAVPTLAQTDVYLGPQVSTQGIGASAEVRFGMISVSGEVGYLPVNSVTYEQNGNEFKLDVQPVSGLLLVNVFPAGRFSLGAGVLAGGLMGNGEAQNLRGLIDVGDNSYPAASVGSLTADFEYGGVAPAVMLGLRSGGINVGLGVAFTGTPQYTLDATGSIRNDPDFAADLALDQSDVQDELDKIPVLPLLRIGWQFGVFSQ